MFIRYYTYLDKPFEDVEAEFLIGAENWLPDLAVKADGQGERMLSELGFKVANRRIARRIELVLGRPIQGTGLTLVPLKWRAASNAAFFPALDGHIEIAALGATNTQFGISASYEPPMGLVGKVADRAMLHRIAEITIRDFMERVGEKLQG